MSLLRRQIKQLLPARARQHIRDLLCRLIFGYDWFKVSFSSCGEDMVLQFLFSRCQEGFYVDVGAYHPIHDSNTYLFYLQRWRGINIDARPGSMAAFRDVRPEDINLEVAISATNGEVTYYTMQNVHNSMNTVSMDFVHQLHIEDAVAGVERLKAMPLSRVLCEHLPAGRRIDFLTVDVEGAELDVLRSNDWGTFRPRVVLIEDFATSLASALDAEVTRYMRDMGYSCFAKTPNSLIFLEKAVKLHTINVLL